MKRRGMSGSVTVLFVTGLMLFMVQVRALSQSVTPYTSAQSWQAAVQGSPQFSETFQNVSIDSYFQNAPLSVGPFSLQQVGQDPTFGSFGNFIDVPPLQFSDNSGVTYAAMYTKFGLITVNMTFGYPVFAWGANFYGSESAELENLVLTGADGTVIATVPVTVDTGFFGFVVNPQENIAAISFQSRIQNPDPSIGQGFGLESVVGAYTGSGPGTVIISPSTLNFGSVVVGTTSQTQSVKVTNNTNSSASYASSTGLSEFSFPGGTCEMLSPGGVLAPGKSCTVNVVFSPTVKGAVTGSAIISSSAGPVTLQASGTGVAPTGTVIISPSTLNFGSVVVGTTSQTQSVKVTNNTNSSASYASSTGLSEFSFPGGTCEMLSPGGVLAPGKSCTVNVVFSPTVKGAVTGSAIISSSAGKITFQASGTGVPQ